MSDDERRRAITMFQSVLAEVQAGEDLTARSAQARRLLRHIEGALIALEVGQKLNVVDGCSSPSTSMPGRRARAWRGVRL